MYTTELVQLMVNFVVYKNSVIISSVILHNLKHRFLVQLVHHFNTIKVNDDTSTVGEKEHFVVHLK